MAASELGDFVVWKRDGEPAYQLAVVVDDARQCINEVVRADDLLASTVRQIALYRALELTPPGFAHLPLVVGEDGRRLAKRHGDTTLRFFREQGMKPEQLVGLLAHWSGLNPQQHQISAAELLDEFSLERVSQQQPVWSGQVR
jgi:glutamyl-tRNA synthetase